jgi:hypothetical protein
LATITKADIHDWVRATTGIFKLADIKTQLNIDPTEYNKLRANISKLVEEGLIVSLGNNDGTYRKVEKIQAQAFWKTKDPGDFNLIHPYGVDDKSHFGFEAAFTFKKGMSYVIGGNSNAGKSTYVLNILWENMDKYKIKYFTNEPSVYTFNERVSNMDWKSPFKVDNPQSLEDCKFEWIPCKENYEDYIHGADIYIIDWINIVDEMWKIGAEIDKIKTKAYENGGGIVVVVLQKDPEAKRAIGGQWTLHFADFGIVLDYGRLTVNKCKLNGKLDNKIYGFDIIKRGSRFDNIREMKECGYCHGKGKKWEKGEGEVKCITCRGKGFVDKEDYQHDV